MDSRPTIRLAEISEQDIEPASVLACVIDAAVGGTAVFVGTVRDHDRGRRVCSLAYSAHPTCVERLRTVLAEVLSSFDVTSVAAAHRVGQLDIGDIAVVVAVAAHHRSQAFAACEAAVDRIKAEVPIWKHQVFDDGCDEWVGV